jgi:branched-chain amino acid transport system permease protein
VTARASGAVVLVVAAAAYPAVAGAYPVKLLQEILIWGVFAMSLDVLMGYAGMVSFGHSAFFGVGAYAAALALTAWPGVLAGFVLPALVSALAALVIGAFCIRVGGVYFIMLTLAFSQMFFALAFQLEWLGSNDGIAGVPRPVVLGLPLATPWAFHLCVVAVVTAAAVVLWRVVRSPFGHVLAGTVAGVAGALSTQQNGYVSPDAFFWTTSGEVLLMVIIGGTGTLGGAVLGAAAFILLQSLVSTYTERWMLILGVTFVLFVLFAPGGIMGALRGRIGLRA